MNSWPTQLKDLLIAEQVMSQFKAANYPLNLFELVVNLSEKSMDFRLSRWVAVLAEKFKALYGEEEGDCVTRRVISCCLREGQTLH